MRYPVHVGVTADDALQNTLREPPISVLSAAKYMAEESGWTLNQLDLQRLIYIAHMMYLSNYERPLVNGNFEAWDYGPVHPALYKEINIFGSEPVQNIFRLVPDVEEPDKRVVLKAVVDTLAHEKAVLVRLSQREHGAWEKVYEPGINGRVISNESLAQEWKDFLSASEQSNATEPVSS